MTARRDVSRWLGISLVVGALLGTTGCAIRSGINPAASPVADSPHGATVVVDWRGPDTLHVRDRAELIAVADTGVILLHDRVLVYYPVGARGVFRVRGAPGVSVIDMRDPDPIDLVDVAPYARHPFGLDSGALDRLLATLGRDNVLVRRLP
ncbi:MAG: hypothetical protein OEN56_07020 [Gemmatimonadota bacterium]|nr:hypothetical protein [Gemmatimonadota bacterium]